MKRIYERLVKDTPLSFQLPSAIQAIDQPKAKEDSKEK